MNVSFEQATKASDNSTKIWLKIMIGLNMSFLFGYMNPVTYLPITVAMLVAATVQSDPLFVKFY